MKINIIIRVGINLFQQTIRGRVKNEFVFFTVLAFLDHINRPSLPVVTQLFSLSLSGPDQLLTAPGIHADRI
jgi:hypothetical protein